MAKKKSNRAESTGPGMLLSVKLKDEQAAYVRGIYATSGQSFGRIINQLVTFGMDNGFEATVEAYVPPAVEKAKKTLEAWKARAKVAAAPVAALELPKKRGRPSKHAAEFV